MFLSFRLVKVSLKTSCLSYSVPELEVKGKESQSQNVSCLQVSGSLMIVEDLSHATTLLKHSTEICHTFLYARNSFLKMKCSTRHGSKIPQSHAALEWGCVGVRMCATRHRSKISQSHVALQCVCAHACRNTIAQLHQYS